MVVIGDPDKIKQKAGFIDGSRKNGKQEVGTVNNEELFGRIFFHKNCLIIREVAGE